VPVALDCFVALRAPRNDGALRYAGPLAVAGVNLSATPFMQ
jgi:hypothetical protein